MLVATGVPHDPHMAVHALEDQPEDTGHLVVHQRGGLAWLKEHVTALRSWASTIAGAEIRLHDHPAISPGNTRALSVDQQTPSHPDVRWHSADLNAGWLSPNGYYWIPEDWGDTPSDASGGGPCKSRHQRRSRRRPHPHVGGGHLGHGARRGGPGRLPPPTIRRPPTMGPHGGRRSHPPPPATCRSRADHGGPRRHGEGGQPDAPTVALGRPVLRRAPADKDHPADPNCPEQWEQATAPTRDTALRAAGLCTPDNDLPPPPTDSDQPPPEVLVTVLDCGHYYVIAATATSPGPQWLVKGTDTMLAPGTSPPRKNVLELCPRSFDVFLQVL